MPRDKLGGRDIFWEGWIEEEKSVKHQSFLENDCDVMRMWTFVDRLRVMASLALLSRNCQLLTGKQYVLHLGPGRLSGRLVSYQSLSEIKVRGSQERALPAQAEPGNGCFHPSIGLFQDHGERRISCLSFMWTTGSSVSRAKLVQQSMRSYKKWGEETHRRALLYEAILFLTIVLKPYFDELVLCNGRALY